MLKLGEFQWKQFWRNKVAFSLELFIYLLKMIFFIFFSFLKNTYD